MNGWREPSGQPDGFLPPYNAEEIALFGFAEIADAASARLSAAKRGLLVRALAERS